MYNSNKEDLFPVSNAWDTVQADSGFQLIMNGNKTLFTTKALKVVKKRLYSGVTGPEVFW